MEPITDVGIDLDGVLYPFVTAFRQYCIRHLGYSRATTPEPTHWHFYEDWNMDKEVFYEHIKIGARDHRLFTEFPPEPTCHHAFDGLREMGIRIHILTHRPQVAEHDTINWLARHNLLPHSIHFVKDKTILKDMAFGKAAMVDDCVDNYVAAKEAGILAVLHSRPWNMEYPDALRVQTMRGFLELVQIHNDPRSLESELSPAR